MQLEPGWPDTVSTLLLLPQTGLTSAAMSALRMEFTNSM